MDQLRQLSSENQPILICICTGAVTITCLQNIVSLTPLDTGQKTVCSTKQLLTEEDDHLYNALSRCKYPLWAWNRTNIKKKQKKNNQGNNNTKKSYIVVPYMKGLGGTCKNICRRYGVEVYFRGGSTIRDFLVHPKDRDTICKKSGVIYRYRCGRVDCEEEYIGESGRTFGERYREHMRAPSPIMDHQNTTGHEVSLDNFSIVGREDNTIARNIKEAIFIRPIPQQEHWQVPAVTHLGWGAGKITRITSYIMPITSGMVVPPKPTNNHRFLTSEPT